MNTNRLIATPKLTGSGMHVFGESDHSTESESIDSMKFQTLLRSEQGLITWGTLLSLLLLMILVSLVSNVAIVVNRKMEIQNSADAIAYSSSVWIARGMNSVSATNHAMGEMNALYSIHHALGGKWLDKHYSDKKRNSGDWKVTMPVPWGFGGLWYKITYYGLRAAYWTAKLTSLTAKGLSLLPPWASTGPGPDGDHYDRVKKHPIADINSAIFEGKEILKVQMLAAYVAHTAGAALYIEGYGVFWEVIWWPPGGNFATGRSMMAAGKAAMEAAKKLEDYIHLQYTVLDQVESKAIWLAPVKLAIPSILKAVYTYQQASVNVEIPGKAIATADNIAKRTGSSKGFALGDLPSLPSGGMVDIATNLAQIFPRLPVEPEKVTHEGRSQMVRATYPWVRKWRYNINLVLSVGAPTSRASDGFIKWSNKYAMYSSQWLRTDTGKNCDNDLTVINRRKRSTGEKGKGIKLYTIYELNDRGQKSQEVWNKTGLAGTKKADEIFCCMGYAKSEQPTVLSSRFFRQENHHGIVCYSQAMIYNANSQSPPSSTSKNQPAVGWDTLAWDHSQQRVREWEDPGFWDRLFDFSSMWPDNEPKIKLNWQAKLTPVTVHKMLKTAPAAMFLDSDMRAALMNARESQFLLQNH